MFFIVRDGIYRPVEAMPFRRFMTEGYGGEAATIRDWELHLSTLFPEVRLKRYIELRGADAGPMPMVTALGALWRGLLDDPDARLAAWDLVAKHSFPEREALRREVPRAALRASLGGRRVQELAIELVSHLGRRPGAPPGRRGRSPSAGAAVGLRGGGTDAGRRHAGRLRGEPAAIRRSWSRAGS